MDKFPSTRTPACRPHGERYDEAKTSKANATPESGPILVRLVVAMLDFNGINHGCCQRKNDPRTNLKSSIDLCHISRPL